MAKTISGNGNNSYNYDIHLHLSGETSEPIVNLPPLSELELHYGHNTSTKAFNETYRPHLVNQ